MFNPNSGHRLVKLALAFSALMVVSPMALAASEPSPACKKCMTAANDGRNTCIKTRGSQEKAQCNKAMSDQVKRCQTVCSKPAGK